MFHC